jgi:hypothetical protein
MEDAHKNGSLTADFQSFTFWITQLNWSFDLDFE